MKRQPILTKIDYWSNHEARVIEIVSLALRLLLTEATLPDNEDNLNRKLFFYIHQANRQLRTTNQHLDWPLFYEARNQPDADDVTRAGREDKRPDFQWGIYDHQEPDPAKSAKYYVLEAKRLGAPTAKSPAWNLNVNYVRNGLVRFVRAEWGYGKSCRSGIMIGYIESMDGASILDDVNRTAKSERLSLLRLSAEGWKDAGVSRLDNRLNRPNVFPTPFDLHHLWIDLRKVSGKAASKKRGSKKLKKT